MLSRSFYAGSQRFGAIWTGDNLGTWEHMAVGIRMTLSDGIGGMTFSGCSYLTPSKSHLVDIVYSGS